MQSCRDRQGGRGVVLMPLSLSRKVEILLPRYPAGEFSRPKESHFVAIISEQHETENVETVLFNNP